MTTRTRRSLTILALVVLPAALVLVPSAGVAKKSKRTKINLEGPIALKKDPGYTPTTHNCCFPSYVPTIQIEAKLGGGKGSKVKVTQYGLWGKCSVAEYSDGESKHEITLKPKKNGSFSGTDTEFGNTLTVAGRIRRNGTASGTVREVEVREIKQDYASGTCDSGTVTWTATRVKELGEPKKSFDPSLIYPAGL